MVIPKQFRKTVGNNQMLMMLLFFVMPCVVLFELLSAYVSTGFILMLTTAKSLQEPFSNFVIKIVSNTYNFSLLCRSEAICSHLLLLAVCADQM